MTSETLGDFFLPSPFRFSFLVSVSAFRRDPNIVGGGGSKEERTEVIKHGRRHRRRHQGAREIHLLDRSDVALKIFCIWVLIMSQKNRDQSGLPSRENPPYQRERAAKAKRGVIH